MSNVVYIKDKQLKKQQEKDIIIRNHISEDNIRFDLNYYELYVIIDICCKYMDSLKNKCVEEYINEFNFENEIEFKKYECENLIRMLKYLTIKFKNCHHILDTHIDLVLDDIYLLFRVFESQVNIYLESYDESDSQNDKKNYSQKSQFEKTVVYFYKEIIDVSFEYINKFNSSNININKCNTIECLKNKLNKTTSNNYHLDFLDYYKVSYINEFLSSDIFVYENTLVTSDMNNYNLSIYFIKPSNRINRNINKFALRYNPNISISYNSKQDIDDFRETYGIKEDEFYKYGEGYRIQINSLTQNEFYNNKNGKYSNIHYYDARENYDFNILNSLDFAKKLNVKILKRKDVLNLELERDSLFESIFNCIEYVILTYKEDCSLSNNGFISNSLCSILKEYYF